MHEWLAKARARLAESVGDDVSSYELSDHDVERLLELARVAAHESGERTNAPLVCYLAGLAHGLHRDRDLETLVESTVGKR